MSDLIERLRSDGADCTQDDCDKAADEIERLNERIAKLEAEIRQKDAVIEAATNLVRAEGWQIERDNLWDTLHDLIDDLEQETK